MDAAGKTYESEYHLRRYVLDTPSSLNESVAFALRVPGAAIEWVYPGFSKEAEPRGIAFIDDPEVRKAWSKFWPRLGPSWDAIGRLESAVGSEWVLVEAKANHPEFCSSPCAAGPKSRKLIEKSLSRVKQHLGVHRHFDWLGTYYQYANRLATLYFLTEHVRKPTRLVFVHFVGDAFPDETPCPESEEEWRELVHACHLTLGLPKDYPLSDRVANVFLPAFKG